MMADIEISRDRKGVAMITVIMVLLFMFIVASAILFMLTQGSRLAGGARRFLSVFEAAESGVEYGMLAVENAAAQGAPPAATIDISVGGRGVTVSLEWMFTGTVSGANVVFGGTGYEGVGSGVSSGGSAVFYRINSDARGGGSERAGVETAYRKIVGINVF